MVLTQAYRRLSRDNLLAVNSQRRCTVLDMAVRDLISRLRLHRRGRRAGEHQRWPLVRNVNTNNRRLGEIPVIIGRRANVNSGQLIGDRCDGRVTVRKTVQRCSFQSNVRVRLLNARSISHKTANIQQWIRDTKLNIVALVETWHDNSLSPDLIASAPAGFRYIDKARPRKNERILSVNHGGVCVLYDATFSARHVQLPSFSSFEVVCAYVHRAGFSAVIVVLYRPGSVTVTQSFFDDFGDLLEWLATFSAPLTIVGDFNIHVDDVMDVNARKLADILDSHSLVQHVRSPTHSHGHTLDLFITRDDQLIELLPVDLPCYEERYSNNEYYYYLFIFCLILF